MMGTKRQDLMAKAVLQSDDKLLMSVLAGDNSSLNCKLANGKTPLIQAVEAGSHKVISMLLKAGANPRQSAMAANRSGVFERMTPLQTAVVGGNSYTVQLLLGYGARVEDAKGGLHSLMSFAVQSNSPNLAKLLLMINREDEIRTDCHTERFDLSDYLPTAVLAKNLDMAKLLLELGADPNKVSQAMLPLVLAASTGEMKMCELLLSFGASVQKLSGLALTSQTPLSLAVMQGLDKAVQILLRLGSQPDTRLGWSIYISNLSVPLSPGSTVVHIAVAKQNGNMLRELIAAGADLSAKNCDGDTPLHIACSDSSGFYTAVKCLLDHHQKTVNNNYTSVKPPFNINAQNNRGHTPLMVAVCATELDIVKMLLEVGADFTQQDYNGMAALHHAIDSRREDITLLLLQHGADPNARTTAGFTPLHQAIKADDVTLSDILIDEQADVHLVTRQRESILHLAVLSDNIELLQLGVARGLDLNARTVTGETALMLCSRQSNTEVCQYLIDQGALLNITDWNQQETALSMSIYFGFEKNARLLIAAGADLNKCDKRKTTLVYWAIYNRRKISLMLLLLAGSKFTMAELRTYPKHLSLMKEKDMYDWIYSKLTNPKSLQELGRLVTRKCLINRARGKGIGQLVEKLTLPLKLKHYLLFQTDEIEDVSISDDDDSQDSF